MDQQFTAGILGAPFGVKGFVKVRSFSGEYDHIAVLKSMRLRMIDGGEATLEVEAVLRRPGALFLKFKNIDSPEAVKEFSGAELIVSRDQAAPLKADEYYIEDLKGMRVISPAGEIRGEITGVLEGGGGNLAEVRLPGGDCKLVPFRKEFFGGISLEDRSAVLLEDWILQ